MSVGEKIRHARKQRGFSQADLAAALGVATDTVSRWETDKRTPRAGDIQKLAALLECPTSYFLEKINVFEAYEGSLDKNLIVNDLAKELRNEYIKINNKMIKAPAPLWVPIISNKVVTACCGQGSAYADDLQWDVEDYFPVPEQILSGYSWQGAEFAIITAEGNSMEPYIFDGDLVLFARGLDVGVGDVCVFSLNNRLKIRGIAAMNGEYVLRAHNKEYQDERLDMLSDNYFVVGKVLRVISTRKVPPVV